MKQTIEARFPAPSAVVMKMLSDRKFYCDRLELQGHKVYEVVSDGFDGKDFHIRFKRKLPMAAIEHEDRWNVASKTGQLVVQLAGMPVSIKAAMSLRDAGQECVLTYDFEIKSGIPLAGGKIEKAIAAENEKAIPAQTQASIELLKNYR